MGAVKGQGPQTMDIPTFKILGFNPLRLEVPHVEGGKIHDEFDVVLPPVHFTFVDLSMGGIIPGKPHLGADLDGWRMNIRIDAPLSPGEILDMLQATQDDIEELHRRLQQHTDEAGPILDREKKTHGNA